MTADFRLQDHPLILMKPRIVPPYGWAGHIPFAYLAVDLLRPACIVELGTHSGNSYMAFCQAVQALKLACHCAAIDTWQGDAHAMPYGDDVYQSLRARHDPLYGSFSSLIRSTFDEAIDNFPDGSVDLLHIDGLHTYEAVRHDFESWLPKLSERAVVLLHDVEVRERDFGVRQFFQELSQRYACFDFKQSHGLGVVAVGASLPLPFAAFLQECEKAPDAVRGFFEALAATLVDGEDGPLHVRTDEPLPVICHLYYRAHDEAYDESRMISLPVDATDTTVDLQFYIASDSRIDYLRVDPSDLPGVYCLSRIALGQNGDHTMCQLKDLPARLGHVNGELLPSTDPHAVRLVSFDDDPNLEFEVASALKNDLTGKPLRLDVRIEYELVVNSPVVQGLLERQAISLNNMRELSRERVTVQNLKNEFVAQRIGLQELTCQLDLSSTRAQTSLKGLEQAMDQMAKRSLWSWLRRRR